MSKSIIILGANYETSHLVESALNLFDEVFVADPYEHSPCKLIKGVIPVNVDVCNVPLVVKICRSHKIEAVALGVADRLVIPYAQICKELNLPSFLSVKTAEALNDKQLFNNELKKNGLRGIPVLDEEESQKHISSGRRVVVKPVDANSSKGLTIVSHAEHLSDAIEKAKHFSARKMVLIEPFMEEPGIGIYLTFLNGECINVSVYERIESKCRTGLNNLPVGAIYKSKYKKIYLEKLHNKLSSLLINIGFLNGVLLFSGYITKNGIVVYDPGARLQGEGADVAVKYYTGIDQKELLLNIARGDSSLDKKTSFIKRNKKTLASIWIYLSEGKIAKVKNLDKADKQPWLLESRVRLDVGSEIKSTMINTEGSVFARFYVCFESRAEYLKIVDWFYENLIVQDFEGGNMIIDSRQALTDVEYND